MRRRDRQRHQQHRVAERVLLTAGTETRGKFQQILGQQGDWVGGHIGHADDPALVGAAQQETF